jgi:hypothetical protein
VLTELSRAQIPPEKLAPVLSAFGRLPEEAQYELAIRLANAVGIYRLRKTVEKHKFPPAHRQRNQLKDISTAARRLLKLLGVDKAESIAGGVHIGSNIHLTATACVLTDLYRVGVQRRPGKLASADERLATLLMLLSDLAETAERSARQTSTRPGHGGDRRAGELTAKRELLQAIIKVYIEYRDRFPSSGPEPAFDEPLRKFVRLGLELAVSCPDSIGPDGKKIEPPYMAAVDRDLPKPTRTTDEAIRGAFQRLLAQTKQKS